MKKLTILLAACMILMAFCSCGDTAVSSVVSVPEENPAEMASVAQEPAATPEPEVQEAEPASAPESIEEESPVIEVSYPLTEDPITLSFFVAAPSGPPIVESTWADLQVFQDCEALTNVHIDWNESSFMNIADNFSLMVASGDYSDLINGFNNFYSGGLSAAYTNDVIIDLADYTETYMPNYCSYAHTEDAMRYVLNDEGNELAVCEIGDMYDIQGGIFLRKDWLDELNMDAPATVDEFTDVLEAFKNNYDCTETLSMLKTGAFNDSSALSAPFGTTAYNYGSSVTEHFYIDEDGKVTSALVSENYRDYLRQLHDWYNAGYFSYEALISNSISDNEPNVGSGITGAFVESATAISTYASYAEDESFELVPVGALSLDGSDAVNTYYKAYLVSTATAVSVSTTCENVEIACQWMDYWYSDDGILAMNYGPQGVSWEYDGDGNVKYTELLTNDPDWNAPTLIMKYNFKNRIFGVAIQDSNKDYYTEIQTEAVELFRSCCSNENYLPSNYLYLSADELQTYSERFSDISATADTAVLQFIIGDLSLDDDWDSFQQQLRSLGIEECIAIYQAAYSRYLAR